MLADGDTLPLALLSNLVRISNALGEHDLAKVGVRTEILSLSLLLVYFR